jgi:hypothetical protein
MQRDTVSDASFFRQRLTERIEEILNQKSEDGRGYKHYQGFDPV